MFSSDSEALLAVSDCENAQESLMAYWQDRLTSAIIGDSSAIQWPRPGQGTLVRILSI